MYPTQPARISKTGLILLALLLAVAFSAGAYFRHESYIKKVSFVTSGTGTIKIGTVDPETGTIKAVLGDSSKVPSLRLHVGQYAVLYSAAGFVDRTALVTLKQSLALSLPTLDFSDAHLGQIKAAETPAISQAIAAVTSGEPVTISDVRLYSRGQWAAAHLTTSASDNRSVVLQKQGDTWEVVAGPAILISIQEHLDIPSLIIRDINNQ
ncbi:MAG: hypothetical protein ABI602_01115 [Candidatus Saccharibacteria bacterium]